MSRAVAEAPRRTGYREIAAEFARRYWLRPRAAWREAHGWSLREAAAQINAYTGTVGLDPGGISSMTAPHLCEHENWPGPGPQPSGRRPSPICWPCSPASTAAPPPTWSTWPTASNCLPPSCSSLIPMARKFPTSATKTVRPSCPARQRSLRRNKPCPRCQPSPTVGSRASASGLLQPENRLDVRWEVSLRFENLAVVPDQWFPVAAQLAHVRSVHLVQDRIQINVVRQSSPVRDIDDVSQRVGNPIRSPRSEAATNSPTSSSSSATRSLASAGSTSTLGSCRIGRLNAR